MNLLQTLSSEQEEVLTKYCYEIFASGAETEEFSYEVYSELLPADKVEKVEELIQIKSEKENMICVFQYNSEASCC